MDAIFKALNDPTRRALLDALRETDGQTLSDLEARLEMSRFGVMKHLGVLEDASLITTRKEGRFKYHYLNAVPLQEVIDRWIEPLLAKPAVQAVTHLKAQLEGTLPMSEKPDLVMETFIRCTQDALWDALTTPTNAIHFHFAGKAARGASEKPGDTYTFLGHEGQEMLTHTVRALDPKSRIELTFEPKWAPDLATSRCVYLIEPQGAACKLTLEHYAIPAGQDGVREGWARVLSGLKTWLETGEDAHFTTYEGASA